MLLIHPYWDMALLQLRHELPPEHKPLTLSVAAPEDLAGRKVVAIGYPAFDDRNDVAVQSQIFNGIYEVKRLMPGEHDGAKIYCGQSVMAHDTSTLGGASGSAVVDIETGEVVGLHYAGVYMDSNYAVPTIRLAEDRRVVDLGVEFGFKFSGTRELNDNSYIKYWEQADASGVVRVTSHEVQRESEVLRTPPPDPTPHLNKFDFNSLQASEFSWQAALTTALASYIVYDSEKSCKDICAGWGLKHCEFVAWDHTECFVAGNDDRAIISFRGTENNIADWLTDLTAIGTTQKYGRVHVGFWAAFSNVAEQLDAAIEKIGASEIVLTGHSLGGALAVIAAAEWFGKHRIRSIYTFGQPAVGKGHFPNYMRDRYDKVFHRFVNNDDIVTKVPPTYRHTGQVYQFSSGSDLRANKESVFGTQDTLTMSRSQFDELRMALLRSRIAGEEGQLNAPESWIPSFRDHSMARYIEKIAENQKAHGNTNRV